jgi:hypothetical protein
VLISKSLKFGKREKFFYRKTEFSPKIVFLRKNLGELLDARVLRISMPNQNHMKQSDLGKSLDPTV